MKIICTFISLIYYAHSKNNKVYGRFICIYVEGTSTETASQTANGSVLILFQVTSKVTGSRCTYKYDKHL